MPRVQAGGASELKKKSSENAGNSGDLLGNAKPGTDSFFSFFISQEVV